MSDIVSRIQHFYLNQQRRNIIRGSFREDKKNNKTIEIHEGSNGVWCIYYHGMNFNGIWYLTNESF